MKPTRDGFRKGLTVKRSAWWLGLLVGTGVAWSGCKKSEPAPVAAAPVAAAAPDAGAASPVEAAKTVRPLTFSEVKLKRGAPKADDPLAGATLTYTLTNPGTAQARGTVCLSLQDAKGWILGALALGPMTVKGGAADTFTDALRFLPEDAREARSMRLFTTLGDCDGKKGVTSEILRLSMDAGPAPAGTPEAREVQPGSAADFELSDATLLVATDVVRLFQYTVKNRRDVRLQGVTCLRMFAEKDGQQLLAEQYLYQFNVGPKEAQVRTDSTNVDPRRWDAAARWTLHVSKEGCQDAPGGDNAGVTIQRPEEEEAEPATTVLDVQMDDDATDDTDAPSRDDDPEEDPDDTAGSERDLDPP
jgi:hypothetical protein